jgi:hypothetical protein
MQFDPEQVFVPSPGIAPQDLIQGAHLGLGCGAVTHRGNGSVKLG